MGKLKIQQALDGVSRLLLDTGPVVFVLAHSAEANRYSKTWALFQYAIQNGIQLVVPPLTLIEVLAKPNATAQELKVWAEFCLAVNEIEFRPIVMDDVFAIRVGYFRRTTNCKVPDCIQFASAEKLDCQAILTNDHVWQKKYPGRSIIVDDLEL